MNALRCFTRKKVLLLKNFLYAFLYITFLESFVIRIVGGIHTVTFDYKIFTEVGNALIPLGSNTINPLKINFCKVYT